MPDISPEHFLTNDINCSFKFSYVNCKEISDTIKNLKNKNSQGHDNISLNLLKSLAPAIIYPLSVIINQSLVTGIFPENMKIGKVIPVYKKGDADLFDNYRPISILSSFSKVLEKIVNKQILNYFTSHDLFMHSQHGFRPNYSTETAAIELVDSLKIEIDKGHVPFGTFMDLSKAFDTIDHEILNKKLQYYGLNTMSLNWFKSYLMNRKQFVHMNGINSPHLTILTGVPQGSILGPILFLIYMNDIINCSDKLRFTCFADDTTLILSICYNKRICKNCTSEKDINANDINRELDKVNKWLCTNKLTLNTNKTKYMVFHNPQRNLKRNSNYSFLLDESSSIKINNIPIERVETHLFLGIKIHQHLTWNTHVDYIGRKIARTIGILKHIKGTVSTNVLRTIYNSLVLPYLYYGILVWGYCCQKLETLQKKCIRIVSKSFPLEHTEKLFKSLNILKISDIFKLKCLIIYFKQKKRVLPYQIQNMFTNFNPNNNYDLRSNNQLILREFATKLKSSEQILRVSLPKMINQLSAEYLALTNLENLDNFKIKLKSLILSEYSNNECVIKNCFPCYQRLFYPSYLSRFFQFIHILSYRNS